MSLSIRFRTTRRCLLVSILIAAASQAGEVLWRTPIESGIPDSSMTLGEVDKYSGPELVLTTTSGQIAILDLNGKILRTTSTHDVLCNAPTLADLYPGGGNEILTVSRRGVIRCHSGEGAPLWTRELPGALDWNQTTLVAADINSDGYHEILIGDRTGNFFCLDRSGRDKWTYAVKDGFHCPPAVGQLTEDPGFETVIASPSGFLIALSSSGQVVWEKETGTDTICGPVLADLDGDGSVEVLIGGEDAKLRAFSADGSPLWIADLGTTALDSTISVADLLPGPGVESVCIDLEGICYCHSAAGKLLWKKQFPSRSRRAPSIADLDADGDMEILVSGYFPDLYLLSAEGEEEDRMPMGQTNGGATLFNIEGRLAAAIPIESGEVVAVTWQTQASAEPARVAWGQYRVNARQTGCTQQVRMILPEPGTPPDTDLLDLTGFQEKLEYLKGRIEEDPFITSTDSEYLPLTRAYLRVLRVLDRFAESQFLTSDRILDVLALREEARLAVLDAEKTFGDASHLPRTGGNESHPLKVWKTNPWTQVRTSAAEGKLFGPLVSAFAGGIDYKDDPEYRLVSVSHKLPGATSEVDLYRHETESVAFNLINLTPTSFPVRIVGPDRLEGVADSRVEYYEVLPVPTELEDFSDDALSELNQARTIYLAPGEVRQLFINVHSGNAGAKDYTVPIDFVPVTLKSAPIRKTIHARVFDLDIREGTAPALCTWGYVYGSAIKDFPEEAWRDRVEHGNNVINITTHYLPTVTYGQDGNLTQEPDFSALREFVRMRQGAFFLFFNYHTTLQVPDWDERFSETHQTAFTRWLEKVLAALKTEGLGYADFALYPVDEPGLHPGLVDLHINHAKMARAADPKVLLYTDPVDRADMADIQRMAPYVDIWCPNRSGFLMDKDPRLEVMRENGKALWTYECLHNVKHQPPLEYYRGQAWLAESHGLTGMGFWSYCTSVDDPWLFPTLGDHDYLLVYPGNGVVTSRRWEAVRDGVEDLRALNQLKAAIASATNEALIEESNRAIEEAVAELSQFGIRLKTPEAETENDRSNEHLNRMDREWIAYRWHRAIIAELTLGTQGKDLLKKRLKPPRGVEKDR